MAETTSPAEKITPKTGGEGGAPSIQPQSGLALLQAAALVASNPRAVELAVEERRAQQRAKEAEILQGQQVAAAQRMERERRAFETAEATRKETEATRQFEVESAARRGHEKVMEEVALRGAAAEEERTRQARVAAEAAAEVQGREAAFTGAARTLEFFRAISAPGLEKGVKFDPKDLLGSLGGAGQAQMVGILADPKLPQEVKVQRIADMLGPVAMGTAAALSAATGGITSPQQIVHDTASAIALGALGVPEKFRPEFFAAMQLVATPLDEARKKIGAGEAKSLTPEETQAWTIETAGRLSNALREGHTLSSYEQELFAKFWRSAPEAAMAHLDATIALAINGVATAEGLDEAQSDALYGRVYDAVNSMVENADARAASDIILPETLPEEAPLARVISDLNMQLRQLEAAPPTFESAGAIEKRKAEIRRELVEKRELLARVRKGPGLEERLRAGARARMR